MIIEEYQILNSYYKRLKYKEFHEMAYYIINKEYESFRIQKFDYQINPIYVGKILFLVNYYNIVVWNFIVNIIQKR